MLKLVRGPQMLPLMPDNLNIFLREVTASPNTQKLKFSWGSMSMSTDPPRFYLPLRNRWFYNASSTPPPPPWEKFPKWNAVRIIMCLLDNNGGVWIYALITMWLLCDQHVHREKAEKASNWLGPCFCVCVRYSMYSDMCTYGTEPVACIQWTTA